MCFINKIHLILFKQMKSYITIYVIIVYTI